MLKSRSFAWMARSKTLSKPEIDAYRKDMEKIRTTEVSDRLYVADIDSGKEAPTSEKSTLEENVTMVLLQSPT